LIAGALATAMLGVMVYLFFSFSKQSEQPLATMSMDQSTFTVVRWLQRDLAETNLQTIRSLPNESGVIMESARSLTNDQLMLSPFGTVDWQKYVQYQVKPTSTERPLPQGVQLGALHYDERARSANEAQTPEPSFPDGPITSGIPERHKELSRSFMITDNATKLGLAVYWVDSSNAVRQFTATERGEPVCVMMSLLEISPRTGQPTIRRVPLQVKPRN
jgi:hypothetical protein